MSQKVPVNNFEWIEKTSQFNEDFIKIYNDQRDGEYFLEPDFQCPKRSHKRCNDLPFLLERMKIEK